ncbi:MAG: HNH endonuclease [Lachnospiraceae bacterium]|nr:HNH endonuclease [Lachnospiraceae bacterium]
MGYRETFFNNTPSMMGKYQCVRCGGWFTKSNIDVDHRIPKRLGGTDDIWNLQAMCKHCNRSKGANTSTGEVAQTVITAGVQGLMQSGLEGGIVNLTKIGKGVAKQKAKDALGIKYRR